MKDPCKTCLVQPACTTKCKDRKTYKKWKIDRRQKFKNISFNICVSIIISIVIIQCILIVMMKQ